MCGWMDVCVYGCMYVCVCVSQEEMKLQNMVQACSFVPLVLDPTGRTGSYWMIPLAFELFWFDM